MRYRYNQASVASIGRAYLIYLGFTTRMVLALFIRGGRRGRSPRLHRAPQRGHAAHAVRNGRS